MIIEQKNSQHLGTAVEKVLLLPFFHNFFEHGKEGMSVGDNVIHKSEIWVKSEKIKRINVWIDSSVWKFYMAIKLEFMLDIES